MKTGTIAASAIVALLVLGATTVAFANSGLITHGLEAGSSSSQNTNSSSSTTTTQTGGHEHDNGTGDQNQNDQGQDNQGDGGHFNLTVGSTLTFVNLTSHWVAFSHVGNHTEDDEGDFTTQVGNSTGAFTFKVTGASSDGFELTITSGKFAINGTTYTVSHGNLLLNEGGESGSGNGTASGGATFEIHVAGIHGNITSAALVGAIKLDVKFGTGTYLVILGSNEGVEENSGGD